MAAGRCKGDSTVRPLHDVACLRHLGHDGASRAVHFFALVRTSNANALGKGYPIKVNVTQPTRARAPWPLRPERLERTAQLGLAIPRLSAHARAITGWSVTGA